MTESKNLCKELEELEKKKLDLQKQKEEALIAEGKAFNCRKCNKAVVKNDASSAQLETTLCYNCQLVQKKKEYKEAILSKIKQGRIIDIELDQDGWYQNIKRITVYKQGMMYKLRAVEDDGEAYFVIDNEWKEDEELEVEEIKPWQKTRKEKTLSTFIHQG